MPTHNWTEYIDGQHPSTAQQNQWLQVTVYTTIAARDTASASFGSESIGKVCLVTETAYYYWWQGASWVPFSVVGGAGAPTNCSFVTINAEGSLSNETQHVNVALADRHAPALHAASHQNAGADEISVTGLSGLLADEQNAGKIKAVTVDDSAKADGLVLGFQAASGNIEYIAGPAPGVHAVSHQNGGGDEINVAGLSGELADNQPPKTHKAAHLTGGGDAFLEGEEVDCLAHVEVQKGGVTVRANGRPTINYTNTASAIWTITDNAGDDRTDIQLTATNAGAYKLPYEAEFYAVAGTYYAMDHDGNIVDSGASPSTVLNNAIGNLTAARSHAEVVHIKGDI